MPQSFDSHNPPFDRLTHDEINELRAALDIGYFRPGEAIVERNSGSDHLHVIIKGSVEERDGDEVEAVLGPKESFDARAVVHGSAGARFIAAEETLCYLAPQATIRTLIRRNPGFAAFFYSEISRKLEGYSRRQGPEGVDSVLRARVRDARTHPAVFIDGDETIEAAGQLMRERDVNALFVRDGERVGIVTGMNLSKAVVLDRRPLDAEVRAVCHFDVVSVGQDDFIFEAVILMTRHSKRRLAVAAQGGYVGVLEDIDILGLVAGNSQLVPGRIDRAQSIEDLVQAAQDIGRQVERLAGERVRVEAIAEITSDLNRRLITKLFEMIAPPSIRDAGCLMIMGSEGRGEQTVRTDQDNGLILAAPVPEADLASFRSTFTEVARAVRLSALPRQRDGPQSAMVATGRGLHPPDQDVDHDARRFQRDELRDLLRRGRGRRATRSGAAVEGRDDRDDARRDRLPRAFRSLHRPVRRRQRWHADLVDGERRGRNRSDRHQEDRHISDRARHSHAVDRARHQCHGDRQAHRRIGGGWRAWRRARSRARERVVLFHGDSVALAVACGQDRSARNGGRSCA